jgi:NitT/TauT family transport system ATP-binding protein
MSKRPGRIVARKENPLLQPRELELTYTEPFNELVHELRGHIGRVRSS